jgi:tetratricopeptide (TPR) repeat protein
MNDIPFSLPEALVSYAIQFEAAPDKTIRRLRKQLDKRGPDPVGYFLLGWFYHRKKWREKAIEYALTAKSYAPGSPFFDHLHYFFAHPDVFDAWQPAHSSPMMGQPAGSGFAGYEPVAELETLIEKLSAFNAQGQSAAGFNPSDIENDSSLPPGCEDVDDIVSETLAEIHEKQGKPEAAIGIYKKLIEQNRKRGRYYDDQIARLQEIKESEQE